MACAHPIWIRNRRYYREGNVGSRYNDDFRSSLALAPWDVSRQWLMVPCGKCEDCLRRLRNDWFVRLERELARCKAEFHQAIFITITIAPKYYDQALQDPAWFIRKWLERVRHKIGHSYKHAFFQEFGTHPETGSEPRLHFHGFLFGLDVLYTELRQAIGDLGFVWLAKANPRRARYCVKYVVKQIGCPPEVADKIVTYNGKSCKLSTLLEHRRYTRKFVSAGLGNYLGIMPAPSLRVTSWDYLDFETNTNYSYTIPRYYDRYLDEKTKLKKAILSADAYSRFSCDRLVRRIVVAAVKRFFPPAAVANRDSYSWEAKQMIKFRSAGRSMPDLQMPTWIDGQIIDFWITHYNLQLQI
jgi:uncharacterized protein (DUF2164 family)